MKKRQSNKIVPPQEKPQAPQQVPAAAVQPQVEKPDPEKLLRRWIILQSMVEMGQKLYDDPSDCRPRVGDKTFLEDSQIYEILAQIHDEKTVIKIVMDVAYKGCFQNPYAVLPALEHNGSIIDKLAGYFQNTSPDLWNIAFCELLVACDTDSRYQLLEACKWNGDRVLARKNFQTFVQGQISPTLHSSRLYSFLFRLFFGSGTGTSFILPMVYENIANDHEAKLMQGLIEKGKEGIFPWVFENYLSSGE